MRRARWAQRGGRWALQGPIDNYRNPIYSELIDNWLISYDGHYCSRSATTLQQTVLRGLWPTDATYKLRLFSKLEYCLMKYARRSICTLIDYSNPSYRNPFPITNWLELKWPPSLLLVEGRASGSVRREATATWKEGKIIKNYRTYNIRRQSPGECCNYSSKRCYYWRCGYEE